MQSNIMMFSGGIDRIFKEFDEHLADTFFSITSPTGSGIHFPQPVHPTSPSAQTSTDYRYSMRNKRKTKKLVNLVENFLDEIICLLNIDRALFEQGNLPWEMIFYHRMLSSQTLLTLEQYERYHQVFSQYKKHVQQKLNKNTPGWKHREAFLRNAKEFLHHIKLHKVDPDNVLIGLTPSRVIQERFLNKLRNNWLSSDAKELQMMLTEDMMDIENHDSLWYRFQYPAVCGEIVLLILPDKQMQFMLIAGKEGVQVQTEMGAVVFGRLQSAKTENNGVYLQVCVSAKEDDQQLNTVNVNAEYTYPLRGLVVGSSWMRNLEQMRNLVDDPYINFQKRMRGQMIDQLDQVLKESFDMPWKQLFHGLQQQPVPFIFYHPLKYAEPIINLLVNSKETPANKFITLRMTFINRITECANREIQLFMEGINNQQCNGSSQHQQLFMPTCDQDLIRLKKLNFTEIAIDLLKEFLHDIQRAILALSSERRELMNGNLKNQISKWWLLLIGTRTDLLLDSLPGYDTSACNQNSYIERPPANIDGARKNLAIIRDLINPLHPAHKLVQDIAEDLNQQVYPVIDVFMMKAKIVLSYELMNVEISVDSEEACSKFDIAQTRRALEKKRQSLLKQNKGEEKVDQYDSLIKDLEYLMEMKEMEESYKTAITDPLALATKLQMSSVVPLRGLVWSAFYRLENILQTVLEVWAPDSCETEEISTSNSHTTEQKHKGDSPVIASTSFPLPDFGPAPSPPIPRFKYRSNLFGTVSPSVKAEMTRRPHSRTIISQQRSIRLPEILI